jgi:porphyrinogen peroxidase
MTVPNLASSPRARSRPASSSRAGDAVDGHIARVEIEDDQGEKLPIWRRSAPYGTLSEHGLYFLAFSTDRPRMTA